MRAYDLYPDDPVIAVSLGLVRKHRVRKNVVHPALLKPHYKLATIRVFRWRLKIDCPALRTLALHHTTVTPRKL